MNDDTDVPAATCILSDLTLLSFTLAAGAQILFSSRQGLQTLGLPQYARMVRSANVLLKHQLANSKTVVSLQCSHSLR